MKNRGYQPEPVDTTRPLNCGHTATETEWSFAPGYARYLEYTLCYECANAWEAFDIARADTYAGYASQDGRRITTWPGGTLARVLGQITEGPRQYTPTGGQYRLLYCQARTPDGRTWWGRGSNRHGLIRLRVLKHPAS